MVPKACSLPPLPHHGARRGGAVVETGPPAGAVAGALAAGGGTGARARRRGAALAANGSARARGGHSLLLQLPVEHASAAAPVAGLRTAVPPESRQDACHRRPPPERALDRPGRLESTTRTCFQRLSPHLYRFPDTCNVYVVLDPTDPTRCVLVDFGDGACLDRLGEIGVSRVDWILHTHHHRDQAQGDHRAVAWASPRRPRPRARLRRRGELLEAAPHLPPLLRPQHVLTLTESVPVAREPAGLRVARLGPLRLPGAPQPRAHPGLHHPPGADRRAAVAFSGDLIFGPGQTVTLYDLQYQYGAMDGVDCALVAVDHLRQRAPTCSAPRTASPWGRPRRRTAPSSLLGAAPAGVVRVLHPATPPPWTPPSWRCSPG